MDLGQKKVKGLDIYILTLTWTWPTVVYKTVGDRLWTPQSAAITYPAALWPLPRNVLRQRLTIFSSEYYHILIATCLPTPEGWKAELAW